jgi:hypothetical protein
MSDCNERSSPIQRPLALAWLLVIEGEAAAGAGLDISANPYDPDSPQGRNWLEGWSGVFKVSARDPTELL